MIHWHNRPLNHIYTTFTIFVSTQVHYEHWVTLISEVVICQRWWPTLIVTDVKVSWPTAMDSTTPPTSRPTALTVQSLVSCVCVRHFFKCILLYVECRWSGCVFHLNTWKLLKHQHLWNPHTFPTHVLALCPMGQIFVKMPDPLLVGITTVYVRSQGYIHAVHWLFWSCCALCISGSHNGQDYI